MTRETETPSTAFPPDEADRREIRSSPPPEATQEVPARGGKAPRVLLAGVGYIPVRLAKWLLGRGKREGPEKAPPEE